MRNARLQLTAALEISGEPRIRVPQMRQLFIGTYNETLSVPVRVNNPNCSLFKMHS
jgi:hypothetical protein